jgi:hypothetical protein
MRNDDEERPFRLQTAKSILNTNVHRVIEVVLYAHTREIR